MPRPKQDWLRNSSLEVKVLQTPTFKRQYKKLDQPVKKVVEKAIKDIIKDPEIGIEKSGDLSGVYVRKFKQRSQQYLLAYSYDEVSRVLKAIGVHENFYRNLKRI